jgi:aminomethyltransferase
VNSELNVNITEPDVSPLQVQGPKSTLVMHRLFGDWINDLRYFWFKETDLHGIPVVVSRTGWSSERGYEIFLRDGQHGDRLWETVMEAGKPFNIGPCAPSHIRRIEGGLLSYGSDITLSENPFELGFGKFVDLDQEANFIGKQALQRIKTEGVKRQLVGLEIDGTPLGTGNEHPWALFQNGRHVGKLTSSVYSPRLKKNIGIALVALECSRQGASLAIQTPEGERQAMVVPFPFYDPQKSISAS